MNAIDANGVRPLADEAIFQSFCQAFDKAVQCRRVREAAQATLDEAVKRETAAKLVLDELTAKLRRLPR